MTSRARTKHDSTTTRKTPATDTRRKRRSRPLPRWLTGSTELDDMAKRRCLMILSVLSGERPVSEVIEEHGLSRGTYYNLEERALDAMLAALVPGASAETSDASSAIPAKRIADLEAKVQRLEQEKRRAERLLFLSRQVLGPGAVTMPVGRPPKNGPAQSSTTTGRNASRPRTKKPTTTPVSPKGSAAPPPPASGSISTPSTPSADGVDAR